MKCPWFDVHISSCTFTADTHAKLRDFVPLSSDKTLDFGFPAERWCRSPCSASFCLNNATRFSPSDEIYFPDINHEGNLISSSDKSPRMNNAKPKLFCSGLISASLSRLLCNSATFFVNNNKVFHANEAISCKVLVHMKIKLKSQFLAKHQPACLFHFNTSCYLFIPEDLLFCWWAVCKNHQKK